MPPPNLYAQAWGHHGLACFPGLRRSGPNSLSGQPPASCVPGRGCPTQPAQASRFASRSHAVGLASCCQDLRCDSFAAEKHLE